MSTLAWLVVCAMVVTGTAVGYIVGYLVAAVPGKGE